MAVVTDVERGQRADARRNRDLLLAAGEQVFADKGPEASVAEIATRAGVGKGTFFRHFPTKDDLLVELVAGHVRELDAIGRGLSETGDPSGALLDFLTIAMSRRQEGDIEFLMRISMSIPAMAGLRRQFVATVSALVRRAQDAGAVRADITGTDVVLLMCAPGHIVQSVPDAPPGLWRRYLGMIFDGLRPEGAHPLPPSVATELTG